MTTFTLKKTYASLPRTVRGQPIVINGDPKEKNFLYCNGNNVFIRNINDTSECDVYSEHSKETSVAKYSPSGFYIASGDVTGKVRIWDTVNPEHILKIEHSAMSGVIKDIDWTMDSQKIIVGGEGREFFGRAFTYDSGNTVGEIKGHSKSINSVSIRQGRPMRAVTGSEDFTSIFYEGPPFKFVCSKSEHTNFVNCVRFSPDGSKFISGGADGKLFMYDGKTSDLIGELGAPKAHAGGIYSICFNADGSKLLSVSGDKTAKIWNIEANSVETDFVLGKQVTDMQVGCLWQGDNIITVSLSGNFNYLDPASPASPKKIIKGHNKPIVALTTSPDGSSFYTASSDGLIVSWNAATGESDDIKGKGHTNQVMDLALGGDVLVSVGIDDTVRFTPTGSGEYSGDSVKLESQPRSVDFKENVVVIACLRHVLVFDASGRKLSSLQVEYEGLSVSINPGATQVAVGSKTRIHIYELSNGTLTEIRSEAAQEVAALSYSPDGAYLAVGSKGKVMMFDVQDWQESIGGWGEQHTAKVTSVQWSPDSRRFASGSVDSHIIIWEQGKFVGKKPSVKAHPLSHINRLSWLDNNTIVTAGQDSNLKIWQVSD
ncbi:actin-interacting protein 1 [Aplysia californica]|uniref:Actin-interacting protein 1 n=1 Tax=Aplysia californica TaxID=6500 RepID=A0ABM0JP66_APLCA|nr:actin-interacting protein 1 [Aplysia californica]